MITKTLQSPPRLLLALFGLAAVTSSLFAAQQWSYAALQLAFFLMFLGVVALVISGTLFWLKRIDRHALLRAYERVQYKDALVIGSIFLLVILFRLYIASAASRSLFGTAPNRIFLAILAGLASMWIGGAAGFLFGLPRVVGASASNSTAVSHSIGGPGASSGAQSTNPPSPSGPAPEIRCRV